MYINILHDTSARRPQCKPGTLHSLFLYSDPSPPTLFPTVLMAQTNSKPNLFPYNTRTCPQLSSFYTHLPAYEDGTDSVPKCQHIKFRCRGITQKKAYNIQYTAKVWNQGWELFYVVYTDVRDMYWSKPGDSIYSPCNMCMYVSLSTVCVMYIPWTFHGDRIQ